MLEQVWVAFSAPFEEIPGVRAVRVATHLPIALMEANERGLQQLSEQAGVHSIRPVFPWEAPLLWGMDAIFAVAHRFQSMREGGLAERLGDHHPDAAAYLPAEYRAGDQEFRINERITRLPGAKFAVLNLSKQHPDPAALRDDLDPFAIATRHISQLMVVVVSAGNRGERHDLEETMSAWAEYPWVLSVGMTNDDEGTSIHPASPTGNSDIPGPDVVAYGYRPEIDDWGTSYAAPRVMHQIEAMAGFLLEVGTAVRVARGGEEGVPLAGSAMVDEGSPPVPQDLLPLPSYPPGGVDWEVVASIVRAFADVGFPFGADPYPRVLREMLTRSARQLPNVPRERCTYGFVSDATTEEYLRSLTAADLCELFAPQHAVSQLGMDHLRGLLVARADALPEMTNIWRRAAFRAYHDHAVGRTTLE